MDKTVEPVVTTTGGKVEGYEKNGLFIFKGIPYAAPPIGEKRWLAPEPVKPWKGIHETKQYSAVAPQRSHFVGTPQISPEAMTFNAPAEQPQSEDCLYLNIWTPGLDNKKRPVMVWIHGGGYTLGSAQGVNGTTLAKRGDTVIVTINYRLGLLGFLKLDGLTGDRIPAVGNEGLLDQVAALKWVRNNIAAFGGDPDNVTIFGQSAGGMSVAVLLAMPATQGLFRQAIPQSGPASAVQRADLAEQITEIILHYINVKVSDVTALRKVPVEQLMEAQLHIMQDVSPKRPELGFLPISPVVDGKNLPLYPLEAFEKGASEDVSVMAGSTLNDFILTASTNMTEADAIAKLQPLVSAKYVPGLIDAYHKARAKRGDSLEIIDIFEAIETDRMFREPEIRLAKAKQKHNKKAFHYIYTWASPRIGGRMKAVHGTDIGFVFGSYQMSEQGPAADTLATKTQDAWLAFARNGDPSCESVGKWPYYGTKRETMLIGEKWLLENDPYGEERKAWEAIPASALKVYF